MLLVTVLNIGTLITPFLLLVFGLALLTTAITVAVMASRACILNLSTAIYNSIIIWIFVSAFTTVASLPGCWGVIIKSRKCMSVYAFGQAVIVVASVAGTVTVGNSFVYYENNLNTSLARRFRDSEKSKQAETFWNNFQSKTWCCGLSGPEDWQHRIPEGCCTEDSSANANYSDICETRTSNRPYVYKDGCVAAVQKYYEKIYGVVYYSALTLSILSNLAFQLNNIILKASIIRGNPRLPQHQIDGESSN